MKEQSEMLGRDNISSLLIRLSTPAMIGFLVAAFYNIVDAIFIGRGVGTLGLAGVSISFPVQMIIMAVGGALGIGGSSVISRRLGAGRIEEANHTFGNIISMVILVSILGVISAALFIEPILLAFGSTQNIMPYAIDYLSMILFGSVFFALTMSTNSVIRAEGNAKKAMVVMILSAVVNIILDPIFIFTLDMGVKGAALATVLSQAIAAVYVAQYFFSGKSSLSIRLRYLLPDLQILKDILAIGAAPFARQVSSSIMFMVVNNMLAAYGGDISVAIYGVINRLAMVFIMPVMGLGQGMQPIVGFNYGARKMERVDEAITLSIKYSTILASAAFLILMIFPQYLMAVFSSDVELITGGTSAMRIMFAFLFLVGFQMTAGATYQAIGKAMPALLLSMARQVLFLIPLLFVMPHIWGLLGVWLAFPASDLLAFIVTLYIFFRDKRRGVFTERLNAGVV